MRAVVVGSGFGGLAAAIRLAAAGHEVTVFEKRDRIGGRAYRYDLGGFRFDAGPTVLTAPHLFDELFALAGERLSDHVDLVPLDPFYRVFDADGGHLDLGADETALAAAVAERSPHDAAGFARLRARIGLIFDAFHPYTERPMLRFAVMVRMLPYLLRHRAGAGVQRLVDRCIRDPFLRRALAFHPLLIGGHPARTPALYALIVEFERRWGVHYARGGTAALVDALGALLGRLGGRVVCGAEVDRIVVERGRAAGVVLADGSVHEADVVVSDADPGHTATRLLRRMPAAAAGRLRDRVASPSMSLHVVYLGTDRTWPASPLAHHNVFLGGGGRAVDRVFPRWWQRPRDVRSIDDLFVYVHVPTRTDPSVAPPGAENLYALVAAPPLRGGGGASDAETARIRDLVVDFLDARFLPGLREHVVVEHVVGPDHFRDVLNTPRGAAFSLQPTLLQSGWFRPQAPVRGIRDLYRVGAGTHPGAGVPAVLASATIASGLIAERWPAGEARRATGGPPAARQASAKPSDATSSVDAAVVR